MFDLPMSDPRFDNERRAHNMIYETGELYALSSTGKVKIWKAEVSRKLYGGEIPEAKISATITIVHGYEDGKMQINSKDIHMGKNVGKANETTPYEQAVLEVQSKLQKKIDEGYSKEKTELTVPTLPMLAHPYEKRKHNITWPAAVQPKIDGVRCTCNLTSNDKLLMFTRKGKTFTAMPHLAQDLILFLTRLTTDRPNLYLDGELYSNTLSFQELAGAVRREDNDINYIKQIHLRLFDCFDLDDPNWSFKDRWDLLKNNHSQYPRPYIKLVNTKTIDSEEEMYASHTKYIEKGYEGIMIRNIDAPYKLRYRSADLQKYKKFIDSEFKIIGFKEGEGQELGCVIWQCETENSQSFWVRPLGSRDIRQILYMKGSDCIGSTLTVRYQELTEDGIPRFPVGITIRDYE
tara:strand:- start:744 stop:1958 length:1215 start_codon:yes stop_codon:yes gene_type:complete